jgi:hypothetical protein
MGTPQAVMRDDLEKLACELDNMIIAADDAGDVKLSKFLNLAADAIDQAIDAIVGEAPR